MITSSFAIKKYIAFSVFIFCCLQNLEATGKTKPKISLKGTTTTVIAAKRGPSPTTPKSKATPADSSEEPKTEQQCLNESKTFEDLIKNNKHLTDANVKTLYADYITKKKAGLEATKKYFAEKNKASKGTKSPLTRASPSPSLSTERSSSLTSKGNPKKLDKSKTSLFEGDNAIFPTQHKR